MKQNHTQALFWDRVSLRWKQVWGFVRKKTLQQFYTAPSLNQWISYIFLLYMCINTLMMKFIGDLLIDNSAVIYSQDINNLINHQMSMAWPRCARPSPPKAGRPGGRTRAESARTRTRPTSGWATTTRPLWPQRWGNERGGHRGLKVGAKLKETIVAAKVGQR